MGFFEKWYHLCYTTSQGFSKKSSQVREFPFISNCALFFKENTYIGHSSQMLKILKNILGTYKSSQ